MTRRHAATLARITAATIATAGLTLAACGGGDDDAADTTPPAATSPSGDAASAGATGDATITIESFAFSGASSVPAGTTITVTNDDTTAHTFTADDGSFDTGTIQPGSSAQVTLGTAGTFAYHCDIHASMTGSVTVTG